MIVWVLIFFSGSVYNPVAVFSTSLECEKGSRIYHFANPPNPDDAGAYCRAMEVDPPNDGVEFGKRATKKSGKVQI